MCRILRGKKMSRKDANDLMKVYLADNYLVGIQEDALMGEVDSAKDWFNHLISIMANVDPEAIEQEFLEMASDISGSSWDIINHVLEVFIDFDEDVT